VPSSFSGSVPSQSGHLEQDANHCLDLPENTRSIGSPQIGQSAGSCSGRRGRSGLRSLTQVSTSSRNRVTIASQDSSPSAISSSVDSILDVKLTSTISGKWALRKLDDHLAQRGREEPAGFDQDVLARRDRADDRRVGRRPADAQFLQGLDQRRLREAGRRGGEVLFGQQVGQPDGLALGQLRKLGHLGSSSSTSSVSFHSV
jgi:hypothetical protein